jgi:hypothetical protein
MITTLQNPIKNISFLTNFKSLFLCLTGFLGFNFSAAAQDITMPLPAETIVCPGTTSFELKAAATHGSKVLDVQWQTLINGTWTSISGSAVITTGDNTNKKLTITNTKLTVSNYVPNQQYRVGFGVNGVNFGTASNVSATMVTVTAAAFTLPDTDTYTNQLAALTFSGTASASAAYNWSFSGAFNFLTSTTAQSKNPSISWTTPGEKKITLTVTDGTCVVTTEKIIMVYGNYTWAGGSNTNWFNAANWSGNSVPSAKDDVTIAEAPFQPEIITNISVRNLTLQSGSLNLGTSTLIITGNALFNGGYLNGGTTFFSGNLEVNTPAGVTINNAVLTGSTNQNIKNIAPGSLTFTNLTIDKTNAEVTLEASVTVTGNLDLKNNHNLKLGNSNLIVAPNGQILAGTAGYVVTNGTGTLQLTVANNNSSVFFPVGNHSYNPVKIKQPLAGTTDVFKVRVQGALFDLYGTDNTGLEPAAEDGISRSWVIEEAVQGGSEAQVTLQFSPNNSGNDWMPAFDLNKAVFAQYTGSWAAAKTGKPMLDVNNNMLELSHQNLTSFRLFGIFNNDHAGLFTLPVELLSFNAARVNGQLALTWSTAKEINNDYFNLEQSTNGKNFSSFAQVKGAGNSSRKLDYNFVHKSAPTGLTYYRLKQTDFDGTVTYSKIIAFTDKQATALLSAYPNPSTGTYKLAGLDGIVEAKVANATGRTIKNLKMLDKDYSLDLSDQKPGIYFLQINTGNEVKTLRLVKN